jgi:PAS domain S-box-containing protein
MRKATHKSAPRPRSRAAVSSRRLPAASPRRAAPDAAPAAPSDVAGSLVTDVEYRTLFDFSPVLWLLLDRNGVVLDLNQSGCELFGLRRASIVGLPLRTWIAVEDRGEFLEHVRQCRVDGHDIVESDARLRSRDGTTRQLHFYSRRARLHGRVVFPTIAVDVTAQVAAEQAHQAAERRRNLAERDSQLAREADAAKDRLIATVSHELRNPLSPALLAATGLSDWPELPSGARQLAAIIKRNIELEARLIDDLLDVARVSRGQLDLRLKTVDLHRVVLEAVNACSALADARRVSVAVELQATSRHTRGDEVRLRQVVWNLLSNAIKFSEPSGTVLVRSVNAESGAVLLTVRDYGAGMDAATLEALFSPFERPRSPSGGRAGLGLGLTIARGIIEGHGGRIWASSPGPDQGSLFEVELASVAAPPAQAVPPPAVPQQPVDDFALVGREGTKSRGRVLIVEDHRDTGMLISLFLSSHGFEVTCVQTLADALASLDQEWDTIVTDLGLPDGNGLEICRRARAMGRPLKLFVLSGYGSADDIAASLAAGCDEHLVKPIDLKRLLMLMPAPEKGPLPAVKRDKTPPRRAGDRV